MRIIRNLNRNQLVPEEDVLFKYLYDFFFGKPIFGAKPSVPRSPKWPSVRDKFLKNNPYCRICDSEESLNVHHIKPFHQFPELELDESNFVTLCENKSLNCHFVFGHHRKWTLWNPEILKEIPVARKLIGKNAKE